MKPKCCINKNTLAQVGHTAGFLKIVAEENRLKILCILEKGERCSCDIGEDIGVPQNLSSHHLKVLKNAGLVASRKEGLKVIYSINKKKMAKFNLSLNNFLSRLN